MEKEKVKKKKKKGKKKKDGRPKKPSEKSILKAKVSELEKELSAASADLVQHESILDTWNARLEAERETEEACVSYLCRSLEAETEAGVSAQAELAGVRDRQQQVEQKALEVGRRLEVKRQEGRSDFMQGKVEMEDKLSRLEERRQKRSSQLSHLKNLEESLADRLTYELREDRQENKQRVEELLRRRDKFVDLVEDVATDHEEMFQTRLPVYAMEQLRDNIRFRTTCQDTAESLLLVQDKNRLLKSHAQESLQAQTETQDAADQDLKTLAIETSNRLDEVLKGVDRHRPVFQDYMEIMRDEIATMTARMEAIQDRMGEQEELGKDGHRKTLEEKVEKARNENGILASNILRANRVFKGRVREIKEAEKVEVDTSVLQQLKMILENECEESTIINDI